MIANKHSHSSWTSHWSYAEKKLWPCEVSLVQQWLLLLALWDVPLWPAQQQQQSSPTLLWVKQLILSK